MICSCEKNERDLSGKLSKKSKVQNIWKVTFLGKRKKKNTHLYLLVGKF